MYVHTRDVSICFMDIVRVCLCVFGPGESTLGRSAKVERNSKGNLKVSRTQLGGDLKRTSFAEILRFGGLNMVP